MVMGHRAGVRRNSTHSRKEGVARSKSNTRAASKPPQSMRKTRFLTSVRSAV